MTRLSDIDGSAALAICESLLLALTDRRILGEHEVLSLMQDAATAHRHAATEGGGDGHRAVAELIEAIIDGGNSVRRR